MYRSVKLVILLSLLGLFACNQNNSDTSSNKSQSNNSVANNTVVEILETEKHATGYFNYGKTASAEEIAGWNIDIRPDGMGLPEGSGSVEDGEMLYEEQCASCHGSFGEGAQGYPVLAGGEDSLTEARPEKTVGSYWPYASTLWDYIHRAMPFQAPQSLPDDEVYALTAYVLYLNELVEDDFELSHENFSSVVMPNQASFYRDDRPDVQAVRCMDNCKDYEVEITSQPANATLVQEAVDNSSSNTVSGETSANIAESDNTLGQETYQAACALCHTSGVAGAPLLGDAAQWKERLAKGEDALGQSSINGIGAMPAKGGQAQLSDEAVLAAVKFMLDELGQ